MTETPVWADGCFYAADGVENVVLKDENGLEEKFKVTPDVFMASLKM